MKILKPAALFSLKVTSLVVVSVVIFINSFLSVQSFNIETTEFSSSTKMYFSAVALVSIIMAFHSLNAFKHSNKNLTEKDLRNFAAYSSISAMFVIGVFVSIFYREYGFLLNFIITVFYGFLVYGFSRVYFDDISKNQKF